MRSPKVDVKKYFSPLEVPVMANVYAKVRVVQTAVACWTFALLPIDIIVAEHSIHSGDMAHTG
jgi:hypothetical protein